MIFIWTIWKVKCIVQLYWLSKVISCTLVFSYNRFQSRKCHEFIVNLVYLPFMSYLWYFDTPYDLKGPFGLKRSESAVKRLLFTLKISFWCIYLFVSYVNINIEVSFITSQVVIVKIETSCYFRQLNSKFLALRAILLSWRLY